MAADPTIKAALDAAAKAMCFASGADAVCECSNAAECRGKWLYSGVVPHAIAAFLRALPDGIVRRGNTKSGFDPDYKPTLRRLAAAVEEAARDE